MKAVIYARVSTKEQPITNQIKKCEEFVISKNGQIVGIYLDEGFSAHNENRPELQRLMRAADNQEFDTVIVSNYSRLFRDVFSIKEFENGLNQLNINLIAVDKL